MESIFESVWFWIISALIFVTLIYHINDILHFPHNRALAPKGYIYSQSNDVSEMRFGFFKSGYNGCGWIAVYNALLLMGKKVRAEKVISELEIFGTLIFGVFGTNPYAISAYFALRGYCVHTVYGKKRLDDAAKLSDVVILWYRRGLMAHFVALKWDGEKFIGYNTYSNSISANSWGDSIKGRLCRKGLHPIMLISVSPKNPKR